MPMKKVSPHLESTVGGSHMRSDRRVLAGGAALVGFVAVLYAVTHAFAPDTYARALLSDISMLFVEAVALALTSLALRKNAQGPYRWTWVFLALWLVSNFFADLAWAWYELVLRAPLPSPSLADLGYLFSYVLGFLTVVFATWRFSDKLRATESALDAMMITLGIAGICWPLVLAPLIRSSSGGTASLVTVAYPLGDLLVIAAFASLLLGSFRWRPPRFLIIIWAAFAVQVVADTAYFVQTTQGPGFASGGYLDSLWALVFALAGLAALKGIYPEPGAFPAAKTPTPIRRSNHATLTFPRMLAPYLSLPVAAALIAMQFMRDGTVWTTDMQVLVYITLGLIVLVVARQFVMLMRNRRLAMDLSGLSEELGDRVLLLAGLTSRLEELNSGAVHLNSLRSLSDIMQDGLELACSVTRAEAGWVTLKDGEGAEPVAAVFGERDAMPEIGQPYSAPAEQRAEEVQLDARGDRIGALWLARPTSHEVGPDLVQAVGAQLAIAIDNTRRYEEVLRLAERDPLTGLYNHRGIHQRLAIEGRRAQQRGGALSLVMIDLDDFKLLNDTYGHPAGDRVLGQVSDTIRSVLRHTDLAGRVGGDEMMLVLPDTDRQGAMQMAQRLQQALSQKPFVTGKDRGIPLHLSLGVATYPSDADTLTGLVGVADASLYASKQRGGDTITEAATRDEVSSPSTSLRGIAGRLMDAVGSRDHYTRRHSDQVAVHALKLAETLGLPEQSLDTLKLAAMLHDVGKIGLGPRILRKPAPLTDEEERSQRLHVDMGEAIIRDLPRVAEVLEAVHAHHERYDGSGYPAGLFGEDIPLLARILAVADAYAAMTIDRPYRAKLTGDQAKVELLQAAGSQLDPELVDAFVRALEKENESRLAAAG
jgi:diguanylate cyclase (GGDEF)-like protein